MPPARARLGPVRFGPGHFVLVLLRRAAGVGALYDGFSSVGLLYGPGYRTIVQAWNGNKAAVARLRARTAWHGTQINPADLDDAGAPAEAEPHAGEEPTARLSLAELEAIQGEALADDITIESKMCAWTAEQAMRYFESGGTEEP